MNDLTEIRSATLPTLIDRAAGALTAAKSSAEVLEARDLARVAYDAAKSAGRMAKAKRAHEEVIAAVYRAQADALLIEARAKMRLADEYDEAQGRGEVAGHGGERGKVEGSNVAPATTADLGLRRDEIHEARSLRDAEKVEPGKTERALNDMVERGEEPTKAKLRRDIKPENTPEEPKEKEPKHVVKLRREFRSLTPSAQEDDWVSLRQHCAELKGQVRDWKQKFTNLQADYKEMAESKDLGPTVSRLGVEKRQITKTRDDKIAEAARLQRRVNAQEAEINKLKKENDHLKENQEITL